MMRTLLQPHLSALRMISHQVWAVMCSSAGPGLGGQQGNAVSGKSKPSQCKKHGHKTELYGVA